MAGRGQSVAAVQRIARVKKAGECHLVLVEEMQAFDNVKSNRGAFVVPMQLSRGLRQCLPQVSTLHPCKSVSRGLQPIPPGFSQFSWCMGAIITYYLTEFSARLLACPTAVERWDNMPKTHSGQSIDV